MKLDLRLKLCSSLFGNTDRAPANKTDAAVLLKAKSLVKEKHFDFNMTNWFNNEESCLCFCNEYHRLP